MNLLIKKIMILVMWYPFRIFTRFLPLKLIYQIGIIGGYLLYFISRGRSKIMAEELGLILPNKCDDEIKEIIKSSFINYSVSEMEVLLYPLMNREFIKKMIAIEGREHLDDALADKKGVLLFQAHFGAFQMVMPAIGYSGYKMNQISASASVWKEESQSQLQKKSFDIKASYEYKLPVKHISVKTNLKAVFSALKKNEIVGITADGGGGKKIVPIKFLGRNANFQRGSVDIAIRTGALIIPVFILTLKNFEHRLIIHPAIKANSLRQKKENIIHILQSYAKLLEQYVNQFPSHYGYTLYLRKSRAHKDPYLFFEDYLTSQTLSN